MSQRAVRWVFTLNNYTHNEEETIQTLPDVEYMVYGREIAPSTRTPHLQGFVVFKGRKYMSWIKSHTTERIHLEIARGSTQQNVDYCTKEGDVWTTGDCPRDPQEEASLASKRKWDAAKEAAREGRFEDIPSDLWIRYRRSFEQEYQDQKTTQYELEGELHDHFLWIYGPTGTGKSHLAREIARFIEPREQPFLKLVNKWWTGYRGESVVIIEEMPNELNSFQISNLKQWLDKWPFAAETKGGQFTSLRPPYVIITSNCNPASLFTEEDLAPIRRKVMFFNKTHRSTQLQWPRSKYDEIDTEVQSELHFTQETDDEDPSLEEFRRATRCVKARVDGTTVKGNTGPPDRRPTDDLQSPQY